MMTATFAAGCFWGVENKFRAIEGVVDAQVGYTGGMVDNPTYEQVCEKDSGHYEAVQVAFDPSIVSYGQLVERFWSMHDATQGNGQRLDIGPQYRSAVFFHSEEQRAEVLASMQAHQAIFQKRIKTKIYPASTFWPAEERHQNYINKRKGNKRRV